MKKAGIENNQGFSLIELLIAMTVTLVLMGLVTTLFGSAMGTRARESRKTDALTSARAALGAISREIANSGYGLTNNGLVTTDSGTGKIHFRANLYNEDYATNSAGEDVTYFFDAATKSIVRFDPHATPTTSVIVNRISEVSFYYYDYVGNAAGATGSPTPTANTGRVRITVKVDLDEIQGQLRGQTVTFSSHVTLRNSNYMLNQY